MANRRLKSIRIVEPELARALTEISFAIQRQVGLLVDRRGYVRLLVVGDARSLFIPRLDSLRRGHARLCGLRLIHTHLNHEPLTEDDLTDLALLRLDTVACIEVCQDGLPGKVHAAHLRPDAEADTPWELLPTTTVHDLQDDFQQMIEALEEEFARRRRPRSSGDSRLRAILVHVGGEPSSEAEESIAELSELSRSAGIDVVHSLSQRRHVDPKYVLGQGKLQQTVIKAMQLGAEALIFDFNLSPAQVAALADYTDLKILDRTQVILDIFAQRAQTREGKIQVELAQLRYLQPRLSEKHTAMSRLTGGIGGRGPGETKLEVDRRRIQDRIAMLEREIGKLGQRRKLRRRVRSERGVPVVGIVGYTNAGKSSLLNSLTHSSVAAEDALFATLNPVSRRLRFPREREIVITDTVGFIRRLPKELMAAFHTTLEELSETDLLLHVVDASRADVDELVGVVDSVLRELELQERPTLIVLNKSDLCDSDSLNGLVSKYNGVPICALDTRTLIPLLEAIEESLWSKESYIAAP